MHTRRQFIGTLAAAAAGAAMTKTFAAETAAGWQIGCYTRPWAAHDYRVALDAIAAAGFKYAGIMTAKGGQVITVKTTVEEAAAIGAEVTRRGLKTISLYGGGFPLEPTLDAGIAGLRHLVDLSVACACPNLLLGGADEQHSAAYYKVVAGCCEYAAGKGVGLSVKPHGGANASGAQCRKIIETVGHKNFRLWYDPGNIFYYSDGKLDPVADAAAVDGLVVGMSVKDFRPPKDVALTPGSGRVDFAKVMGRLRQGGFTQGPLVVECLENGGLTQLAAEAVKARRFVEELVGQGT